MGTIFPSLECVCLTMRHGLVSSLWVVVNDLSPSQEPFRAHGGMRFGGMGCGVDGMGSSIDSSAVAVLLR